jgi:hypothetical protein
MLRAANILLVGLRDRDYGITGKVLKFCKYFLGHLPYTVLYEPEVFVRGKHHDNNDLSGIVSVIIPLGNTTGVILDVGSFARGTRYLHLKFFRNMGKVLRTRWCRMKHSLGVPKTKKMKKFQM